ncbi:MAG: ATP synthase F1 subunit epsilon [Phycisphaerae bacterium]|jgi:F-type H+-transporting ATPase subunit epsilon
MPASKYTRKFSYEVLTPAGQIIAAEAVSAVFPASDGEVGILAGRAPLVTALGAGRLVADEPGGQKREWFVSGGFAQVGNNRLVILAEQCVEIDQLDPAAAQAELEKARQMPVDNAAARKLRNDAVQTASRKAALAAGKGSR